MCMCKCRRYSGHQNRLWLYISYTHRWRRFFAVIVLFLPMCSMCDMEAAVAGSGKQHNIGNIVNSKRVYRLTSFAYRPKTRLHRTRTALGLRLFLGFFTAFARSRFVVWAVLHLTCGCCCPCFCCSEHAEDIAFY